MAWISQTFATAVPVSELGNDPDPKAILGDQLNEDHFVFTHSRNGAIFTLLKDICTHSPVGADLYLFNDSALLQAGDIERAADPIQALIQAIEANPEIVLEATKRRHETTMEVDMAGFKPHDFQVVYPDNATIKDGWVYFYSTSEVLELLERAVSASAPCPPHDDEGEGLEYAFGLLKSHLSLLRHAAGSGCAFVYAEMN